MIFLSILGLTLTSFAQVKTIELSEVKVSTTNYKYLNDADFKELPIPIKILHQDVADYDIKNEHLYEDKYETYSVYFDIPEGRILAIYDQNSKLLRTIEKFKNIKLPLVVSKAITKNYPDWHQAEDVFLVNYYCDANTVLKYKVLLIKGEDKKWVKLDDDGNLY